MLKYEHEAARQDRKMLPIDPVSTLAHDHTPSCGTEQGAEEQEIDEAESIHVLSGVSGKEMKLVGGWELIFKQC